MAVILPLFPNRIEIWNNWFFGGGRKTENPEKLSRSKDKNQKQIQPSYEVGHGFKHVGHMCGRRVL